MGHKYVPHINEPSIFLTKKINVFLHIEDLYTMENNYLWIVMKERCQMKITA